MVNLSSRMGVVTDIQNTEECTRRNGGCYQMMAVNCDGFIHFIVSPETYFDETVCVGDAVIAFFDADAPVAAIQPPRLNALAVAKSRPERSVKADTFNRQLISSDGQLRLNLAPCTKILLKNGQPFLGNPADRSLIVFYGPTTKSVPAITVPEKIIVWC